MKVAFAVLPEKGHLHPYIGPAQALEDMGHAVVFAAPGDLSAQLERAGLAWSPDLLPAHADDRPTRGAGLVALIQDPVRMDGWVEQLLLGHVGEQVEPLTRWLQREQAHAVVIDPLYYAAAIAAHRIGLPWASVSNSLNPVLPDAIDSALLRTMRRIDPRRSALFAQHGLSACFRSADVLSPFLTIAFTTPALVGDVEGVEQVGPSWPLRLRGDEVPLQPLPAGVPVIYASFGSQIYHWPHIFDKLIAAAARLSSHIVLSMGDLARRDPPPHCHMYSYAPQLQVLRHASVFITHGGANSVMEAITASVPMLISPMCNDQFHQAWFVERAEIGLSMDLNTAGIADIAECLARLCDPSSRQRAAIRRVSASYQVNGSHRAAALIAGMVR